MNQKLTRDSSVSHAGIFLMLEQYSFSSDRFPAPKHQTNSEYNAPKTTNLNIDQFPAAQTSNHKWESGVEFLKIADA